VLFRYITVGDYFKEQFEHTFSLILTVLKIWRGGTAPFLTYMLLFDTERYSAKTQHNHISLNLQYKPLITMYKYHVIKNHKNFKYIFHSEERSSGKTWISSLILICLFKRNSEILVSLQWTKQYVSYGRLFTSCQNYHMWFTDFVLVHDEARKNLPSNRCPCSWQTQWCKLTQGDNSYTLT